MTRICSSNAWATCSLQQHISQCMTQECPKLSWKNRCHFWCNEPAVYHGLPCTAHLYLPSWHLLPPTFTAMGACCAAPKMPCALRSLRGTVSLQHPPTPVALPTLTSSRHWPAASPEPSRLLGFSRAQRVVMPAACLVSKGLNRTDLVFF